MSDEGARNRREGEVVRWLFRLAGSAAPPWVEVTLGGAVDRSEEWGRHCFTVRLAEGRRFLVTVRECEEEER